MIYNTGGWGPGASLFTFVSSEETPELILYILTKTVYHNNKSGVFSFVHVDMQSVKLKC